MLATVPDPDLEIRGGGGGGTDGHPDPEIRVGGGGLQKNNFRTCGPPFGLKIRRGRTPPPEPLHWIRHCAITGRYLGFRCIQGEGPK